MKIAYTMNGLIGGFTGKNYVGSSDEDSKLILRYVSDLIDKNIREHNDIDIFVFSWHTNFEDDFKKCLNPVKLKLEPQKDFDIPVHLLGKNDKRVIAHKSRWYGYKEVIKLVTEYEIENNFEYDLVLNARFDMCWNKPMNFDKTLDPNKFHIPYHIDRMDYGWPNAPEILDHIFVSNSKWMKYYVTMFEHLDEYTLPGQCPQWNTISHHFLMVWHLSKLGLLSDDIISKSFSCWTDWNPNTGKNVREVDYDIFRYRNLDREKVLKELKGK
jgi:hypothetical protein